MRILHIIDNIYRLYKKSTGKRISSVCQCSSSFTTFTTFTTIWIFLFLPAVNLPAYLLSQSAVPVRGKR